MEYKSANDLLAVLEGRGLGIRDRALAGHYLDTIGHHRLSAFYPFFYDGAKKFDPAIPTAIEDVFHLYSFDRRLRLLLVGPLEKIEVALRALIIKEIGDFLLREKGEPAIIDLFAPELYDLSTEQNRTNLGRAKEGCVSGARSHWYASLSRTGAGKKIPKNEQERAFRRYYQALPAWTILQAASFGPLTHIFSVLRPEIAYPISNKFRLSRAVLTTTFFALKELRNSCAHHEPVWNWDARIHSVQLKFPKRFVEPAGVKPANENRIYPYCALIHILLSFLSNGESTWHRRLKKLVNEFNTMYSPSMGFPEDWQTMPFWCVAKVERAEGYVQLRSRVQAQTLSI